MAKLNLTITTPSAIFYDDLVDIVTLRVNLG
ncbi:F0F1 ATP synthase subunit epsilon, partial [Mycoplasmopsis synoviae]